MKHDDVKKRPGGDRAGAKGEIVGNTDIVLHRNTRVKPTAVDPATISVDDVAAMDAESRSIPLAAMTDDEFREAYQKETGNAPGTVSTVQPRRSPPDINAILQGHREAEELARRYDLPTRPTTDLGNSERLRDQFGDVLRFDHSAGKWRYWDGRRWAIDVTGVTHHLAKIVIRRIHNEARDAVTENERKDLGKWAVKSENASSIKNMLVLAQADPVLATVATDYDTDTDALNVNNGIVDLRTGELHPHSPAAMHSKLAPVDFRPELLQRDADQMPGYVAVGPTWAKFQTEICTGRRDLMRWKQTFYGYAATGHVDAQIIGNAVGKGSNGKSEELRHVGACLGDYFQSAPPSLIIDDGKSGGASPEIARLVGVRLLEIQETRSGDKLHESRIKWLSGGDRLVGRHLYGAYIEFDPTFTALLVTNALPRVTNGGHAVWRRIRVLPYDFVVTDEHKDPELPEKLNNEKEAILAWIIEGAIRWYTSGFPYSETVDAASAAYKADQDAIGPFLHERTTDGGIVTRSEIYHAYKAWAEQEGEHPMHPRKFHAAMRERGYEEGTYRSYTGISLREGSGA
ncbi:MAG: hypothetical protein HUJ16_03030 [Kangiella sp.]|nr:hypothetical protein [Kangiella sp.]